MYSEVDFKKLGKKLLSHRPHHSVSSRTKEGCYLSTSVYCIVPNTFLDSTFSQDCHGCHISPLWILCLAPAGKFIVYAIFVNTYLPNRICVPLLPHLSSSQLSSFFDLYPMKIKSCKYKYIFNILISSTKILNTLGLLKIFISQKDCQSNVALRFFTYPL